jgi:hypothetical protein
MTTVANLFFWGTLGLVGMLAVVALLAGLWFYALVAFVIGAGFAFTRPFILGKRWFPPAPSPTRRPVVRRRRA